MKIIIIISSLLFFLSASGQNSSKSTKIVNTTPDTTYIPVDLEDCIKQLDSIFIDSNKIKIKLLTEDDFSGKYHFGFGMWMRNNWGLWSGSRLSKFFKSLGIYHPDDMTGIIFDSYHRYLLGKEIKLDEQVKFYQDYWEKAEQNDLNRKKKEFKDFNIGDTIFYLYKNGFVSQKQEDKYDNDLCNAKGIVVDKDENKFDLKVKLIDGCHKKGVIYYDSKNYSKFNPATSKFEPIKKRTIKYLRPNEEIWFNYSDWETND